MGIIKTSLCSGLVDLNLLSPGILYSMFADQTLSLRPVCTFITLAYLYVWPAVSSCICTPSFAWNRKEIFPALPVPDPWLPAPFDQLQASLKLCWGNSNWGSPYQEVSGLRGVSLHPLSACMGLLFNICTVSCGKMQVSSCVYFFPSRLLCICLFRIPIILLACLLKYWSPVGTRCYSIPFELCLLRGGHQLAALSDLTLEEVPLSHINHLKAMRKLFVEYGSTNLHGWHIHMWPATWI